MFFLDLGRVAIHEEAAICYTDNDGYYDVIVAKYNYVRGKDIKKWVKTKGRSNLSWEDAVKKYNLWNNK